MYLGRPVRLFLVPGPPAGAPARGSWIARSQDHDGSFHTAVVRLIVSAAQPSRLLEMDPDRKTLILDFELLELVTCHSLARLVASS